MSAQVKQIIRHLHGVATMQDIAQKAGLSESIKQLQQWQCKRLSASHQMLWQDPLNKPAMDFFLEELYGPKDFSQRDQDIGKVIPKMAKLLPEKALLSLEGALHLHALSYELDFDLVRQLGDQPLNTTHYASAYRACNNHKARDLQIDYIERLGKDLAEVVRVRGINTLLAISAKPAKLAGVEALHQFLVKGFTAFKQLGDPMHFVQPIVSLERQIMHSLFDGRSDLLPQL